MIRGINNAQAREFARDLYGSKGNSEMTVSTIASAMEIDMNKAIDYIIAAKAYGYLVDTSIKNVVSLHFYKVNKVRLDTEREIKMLCNDFRMLNKANEIINYAIDYIANHKMPSFYKAKEQYLYDVAARRVKAIIMERG